MMNKQEAYAELARRIAELNATEDELKKFAEANGLMMGRSKKRPFRLKVDDALEGRVRPERPAEDASAEEWDRWYDAIDNKKEGDPDGWLYSSVCW
jgi:hypothetical protein